MTKARVVMLVINPMTADTRVEKEALSLSSHGCEVTVVATSADGLPRAEQRDGYEILRLPYRRVVKDSVLGRWQAAHDKAQADERALLALRCAQPQHQGLVVRLRLAVVFLRLAAARMLWLLGAARLKTWRSAILPTEYWRGSASRLLTVLERPDVVHAHDLGTLAAAVRLANAWARTGRRPAVVYDSHELYVEQRTSWSKLEKGVWRLHERRWIRHADAVVTVSSPIAQELRRRYRLPTLPTVIANTPDTRRALVSHSNVRRDAGVSTDGGPGLVVYAGSAKPGRGVELLIEAMAHHDWHLALVGAGPPTVTEPLVAAAEWAGVSARLHVIPGVPAAELPGYLATADLGVHPLPPSCLNHVMALPNKLFDYAFAGLPCIVPRGTEMARFVEAASIGSTFEPASARDLGRQIARVLSGQQAVPAPAAVRMAVDDWQWASMEDLLFRMYATLRPQLERNPSA